MNYDLGVLRITVPVGVGGPARVRVEGGGSDTPLLLIFADDPWSLRLFPVDTPTGPVLVYGPTLVRGATLDGPTAHLTGDTVKGTGMEVWAPRGIDRITWNGRPLRTSVSTMGSLRADMPTTPGQLPVPAVGEVRLPALGGWRRRTENFESLPDYDDSGWTTADRTGSYSVTPVPKGGPVLFADDYGFHYGDVWYRGRLTAADDLESVSSPTAPAPRGC